MSNDHSNRDHGQAGGPLGGGVGRRAFIAAGSGIGVTMLAGCTSGESTDGANDGTESDEPDESDGAGQGGNFRLLISDMPADIGDFDRLDVAFDFARVFDGGNEGSDEEGDDDPDGNESTDEGAQPDEEDEDGTESDDDEPDESQEDDSDESQDEADESQEDEADEDPEAGDGVERSSGFYRLDLEGATVDLTEVIGEKAMPVFGGALSPGTYEKVELHVSDVEGIVDGEPAPVKVPSEKLQITHPFELDADEPVDFVFDINVVKRGPENGYNLKPVISESGVAGEDVEVQDVSDEADPKGDDEAENDEDTDGADDEGEENGDENTDENGDENTGENDEENGDENDEENTDENDEENGDENGGDDDRRDEGSNESRDDDGDG